MVKAVENISPGAKHKSADQDKESTFMRLWNNHESTVTRVLFKMSFILFHEFDDYRQEIFIHAWNNFDKFQNAQKHGVLGFGSWLYVTAKGVAIRYRFSLIHKGTRNMSLLNFCPLVFVEDMTSFQQVDEPYCEDLETAIHRAILDLSDQERKVVELYVGGKVQNESIKAGKNPAFYSVQFSRIKKKILNNRHRYFDDIAIKETRPPKSEKFLAQVVRPVYQIDSSGNVVNVWPSLASAEKAGFMAAHIASVASGKRKTHGGFYWKYADAVKESQNVA